MNCQKQIRIPGINVPRFRDCKRKAIKEVQGIWYCGQHTPNAEKERRKRREQYAKNHMQEKLNLYVAELKARRRLHAEE